jgi:hypothetical protein
MPDATFFDWINRFKGTQPNEVVAQDLYSRNKFGDLIKGMLRQSGAYGRMNPFYLAMLERMAPQIAMQQQLEAFARSPEEGFNAPNTFVDYVKDWIGSKTAKGREGMSGFGFMAPSESQAVARQFLSNLNAWKDAPTDSQEWMAAAALADPSSLPTLQAMLWGSKGPGYGGLFRNALGEQWQNAINFLEYLGPEQNNFWGYLSGLYGGGMPNAVTNPAWEQAPTPAGSQASAEAAATAENAGYQDAGANRPTLTTEAYSDAGASAPVEPATTTAQKTLAAPDVAETARAISGQRPGGRYTLGTGEGNSTGTVRPAIEGYRDAGASAVDAAQRLAEMQQAAMGDFTNSMSSQDVSPFARYAMYGMGPQVDLSEDEQDAYGPFGSLLPSAMKKEPRKRITKK